MSSECDPKEDRTNALARPKVNLQLPYCRPTIYWVDKIPKALPRVTVPVLNSRQEELSQFKMVNADFRNNRPTAMWPVSGAALKAEASPRVKNLAQPRSFIDDWALSRPCITCVSKGAMNATPSQRIMDLAIPKRRPPPPPLRKPKKLPRGPTAGIAALEKLAQPRIYVHESRDPCKVSKAALQYVPTPRILEISRPIRARAKVGHVT